MTTTAQGKEALYHKYLPLARHLANRFARRYGRRAEELAEEAEDKLTMLVATWDDHYLPKLSSPCSYIYSRVYYHLLTCCVRPGRAPTPMSHVETTTGRAVDAQAHPGRAQRLRSLLGELTDDARLVVEVVLNTPSALAEDLKLSSVRRAQEALRDYLVDYHNWDERRLQKAWSEVAVTLA